jgi:hypothetical protein
MRGEEAEKEGGKGGRKRREEKEGGKGERKRDEREEEKREKPSHQKEEKEENQEAKYHLVFVFQLKSFVHQLCLHLRVSVGGSGSGGKWQRINKNKHTK